MSDLTATGKRLLLWLEWSGSPTAEPQPDHTVADDFTATIRAIEAEARATPTPDTLDALDAVERSLRDAYGDVNDVWVPWTVIRAALVTREETP